MIFCDDSKRVLTGSLLGFSGGALERSSPTYSKLGGLHLHDRQYIHMEHLQQESSCAERIWVFPQEIIANQHPLVLELLKVLSLIGLGSRIRLLQLPVSTATEQASRGVKRTAGSPGSCQVPQNCSNLDKTVHFNLDPKLATTWGVEVILGFTAYGICLKEIHNDAPVLLFYWCNLTLHAMVYWQMVTQDQEPVWII